MDTYIPRLNDVPLSVMIDVFGAVEVYGTKWCGKTRCAQRQCRSTTFVSRENMDAYRIDPSLALEGERPHLVDEWQDAPGIWDATKRLVDQEHGQPGLVVLTGSSTDGRLEASHDGAGRIARLRMRPMALVESGESSGEVSLAGLFDGERPSVSGNPNLSPVINALCRGGWPQLVGKPEAAARMYMRQYVDATFDPEIMYARRHKDGRTARACAFSLARNLSQAVTVTTVATDMGVTNKTASEYIELLEDLYIIDALHGWDAPVRSSSRVRTKPKYYFCDPSIPLALLSMTPKRLENDGQTLGLAFESLAMRDLMAYMGVNPDASPESVRYYRDSDGLEVDAVLELADGRWGAVEIKLSPEKIDRGAASLLRLHGKIAANPAARAADPSFLAVLTPCGPSYLRPDGVYVMAATSLGA